MFSGIVEAQSKILDIVEKKTSVQILVRRPVHFDDLKIGDSICVNGICLTIEKFDADTMQFSLGLETLKFLKSAFIHWQKYPLNLERSLKLGDRVHGHLVTGHVDQIGRITRSQQDGECWLIDVLLDESIKDHQTTGPIWGKGAISINGVSLTVNNSISGELGKIISVCLIPETIQKTNLSRYNPGDFVMIETDYLAKAYFSFQAQDLR